MSETLSLPVLPLDDSVVLPTMVVPLDISDAEVRAASRPPGCRPGQPGDAKPELLLVPRIGRQVRLGRHARRRRADRPAARAASPPPWCAALSRVRIGTGTVGPGAALWVEGTVVDEPPPPRAPHELAREYRAIAASILQKRGAWQVIDMLQHITDPSALADSAGYAAYLTPEQKHRAAGDRRPRAAAGQADRLGPRHLAELDVAETIQQRRPRGHGEAAARVPAAPAARGHPQGAGRAGRPAGPEEDDYRARVEAADLPEKVARGGAQGSGQAGARLRPDPRGELDPHLAGHGAGDPVEHPHRRRLRHRRRARGAGRRPRRASTT